MNSSVGYQADERSRPRARRYGVRGESKLSLGKAGEEFLIDEHLAFLDLHLMFYIF